jgi:hypothetical protein
MPRPECCFVLLGNEILIVFSKMALYQEWWFYVPGAIYVVGLGPQQMTGSKKGLPDIFFLLTFHRLKT